MNMLAQMRWPQWSLAWLLIFVCGLLILIVLLQRGRGGGLTGAFGGAGGSSAFGAKTGDVFTWITVVMAFFFVLLAVSANFVFDQSPKPVLAAPVDIQPAAPEVPGEGGPVPVTVTPVDIQPQDADAPTGEGDAAEQGDEEQPSP